MHIAILVRIITALIIKIKHGALCMYCLTILFMYSIYSIYKKKMAYTVVPGSIHEPQKTNMCEEQVWQQSQDGARDCSQVL
jgi:EamA domain-containing membrane protein RarD